MAKQHREIEVDRDVIRLTRFGFDNCEKYDPTFQRDIEYQSCILSLSSYHIVNTKVANSVTQGHEGFEP